MRSQRIPSTYIIETRRIHKKPEKKPNESPLNVPLSSHDTFYVPCEAWSTHRQHVGGIGVCIVTLWVSN